MATDLGQVIKPSAFYITAHNKLGRMVYDMALSGKVGPPLLPSLRSKLQEKRSNLQNQ